MRTSLPVEADDVYVKDLRTGQITPVIQSPEILRGPSGLVQRRRAYLLYKEVQK